MNRVYRLDKYIHLTGLAHRLLANGPETVRQVDKEVAVSEPAYERRPREGTHNLVLLSLSSLDLNWKISLTDFQPLTLSASRPVAATTAFLPPFPGSVSRQLKPHGGRCKIHTGILGRPEQYAAPGNTPQLHYP